MITCTSNSLAHAASLCTLELRARNMRPRQSGAVGTLVYGWRLAYASVLFPLMEPLLTNRDFFWVFLTRFFMQLGQYTVQVRTLHTHIHTCIHIHTQACAHT
jgi:hypothetical protein